MQIKQRITPFLSHTDQAEKAATFCTSIHWHFEENPDWGFKGAKSLGGCPLMLMLYVENVDAVAKQAIDAGMTVKKELEDQFYGDRLVTLTDPYGYDWCLGTHIEDVSAEETQQRLNEMQ